jgi:hypothetical protein
MPGPSGDHERATPRRRKRPRVHPENRMPKRPPTSRRKEPPDKTPFGAEISTMPYYRPDKKPPAYSHPRPRRRANTRRLDRLPLS